MLEIKNLHVKIEDKEILKGLNLKIMPGETHAIMGPNGAGKSTLSNVITGHEAYEVTSGEIMYQGKNLLELETHERAAEGIFLAFQYPVEIAGINTMSFLKTSLNAIRKYHGQEPMDALEFLTLVKAKMGLLKITDEMLKRALNVGFSGGEKKRNEILQMAVLNPALAILDETDSGLDIDALKLVSDGVNQLKTPQNSRLVITHYQRLLEYIVPDYVHILADGKIIQSGDKRLALELEEKGYQNFVAQKG